MPGTAVAQTKYGRAFFLENVMPDIFSYLEKHYSSVIGFNYSRCEKGFIIYTADESKKCEKLVFSRTDEGVINLAGKAPYSCEGSTRSLTMGEIREIYDFIMQQLPLYYRSEVIKRNHHGNTAEGLTASDNDTIDHKMTIINHINIRISAHDEAKDTVVVYAGHSTCIQGGSGPIYYLQKKDNKWVILEIKFWTS